MIQKKDEEVGEGVSFRGSDRLKVRTYFMHMGSDSDGACRDNLEIKGKLFMFFFLNHFLTYRHYIKSYEINNKFAVLNDI